MPRAFRLRVDLVDSDPPIWRTHSVPAGLPLDRLHGVLQTAMGWTNSHLHRFETEEGVSYQHPFGMALEGDEDERGVRLDTLLVEPGDALLYEYDFGDGWEHAVVLEAVDPDGPDRAVCLDGENAGPPEDSGGTWRYNEIRPAFTAPGHEEHAELMEWIGPFDPDAFDVAAVNRALAGRRRSH
ncbi:plasmid pRiA4b ORF-3 family protein [Rubrivirga sp.]|uniref:plasmid pRiA4b ORF-3 family protein n=1 Tax=Rubrivirga sp. TaxID=1885344 RepID=UPI003B5281CF